MRNVQQIRNLIDRLDASLCRKMDPETWATLVDARDEIQALYSDALDAQTLMEKAKRLRESGEIEAVEVEGRARAILAKMLGGAA